jgi:hypothetical protein
MVYNSSRRIINADYKRHAKDPLNYIISMGFHVPLYTSKWGYVSINWSSYFLHTILLISSCGLPGIIHPAVQLLHRRKLKQLMSLNRYLPFQQLL